MPNLEDQWLNSGSPTELIDLTDSGSRHSFEPMAENSLPDHELHLGIRTFLDGLFPEHLVLCIP